MTPWTALIFFMETCNGAPLWRPVETSSYLKQQETSLPDEQLKYFQGGMLYEMNSLLQKQNYYEGKGI